MSVLYFTRLFRISAVVLPVLLSFQVDSANAVKGNVTKLFKQADQLEKQEEWLQAARIYHNILELNPKSDDAVHRLVFVLRKVRAPYLTNYFVEKYPSLFSEEEKYQVAHDAAASLVHYGQAQMEFDHEPSRFTSTDIALDQNAEVTQHFGPLVESVTATKFDRIVALIQRGRRREAIDLYRSLVDAGNTVPTYVKAAIADTYMFLDQPEKARDLNLLALSELNYKQSPTAFNAQISLMYAYNELDQFAEAEALADKIVAEEPKVLFKGFPELERSNPNYLRACVFRTEIQINNNRLELAEKNLTALRLQAPFDGQLRETWGQLHESRDKPRLALDEYSLLLIDEPKSSGAATKRGEALLILNEFAAAKKVFPPIAEKYPEAKETQVFAEMLTNYDKPFYKIESTFGQGGVNSADSLISAHIYSSPLTNVVNDRVRFLAHVGYASGKTVDNITATRSLAGVGFDFRSRDVEVEAEVNHTVDNPNLSGVAASVNWNISDAWSVRAVADTNYLSLPAAALAENGSAKEMELNLTWSKNEARKIGGGVSQLRFADDNIRNTADLWWSERWISGPRFILASSLQTTVSRNSELNRDYFNPESDREVNLALNAETLIWHRGKNSLRQRVIVNGGVYWQQNFGSGGLAGIRYEHEWKFAKETVLQYGVGWNFQPYDGVRDYRRYVFLNLQGHI